jgi:hypothetical protein
MEKLTDGGTYKVNMSYSPANIQPTMITHRAAKIAQNGSAQQSFTFKDENVGSVIARVANIKRFRSGIVV